MGRGIYYFRFMQIAERSPTYGSHFYQARDKAGTPWAVAINSRGIYQYNMNDLSKPKKVVCDFYSLSIKLLEGFGFFYLVQ